MKEKNGEHPYGDTVQIVQLLIFLIAWVTDSFFWHRSTFLSNDVPFIIRVVISAILMIAALVLFSKSHFITDHENRPPGVVSGGVFSRVRHPLYLGVLLFYLCLVISTMSLLSFALFIAIFSFYNYIAGYEEKLLEAKFGEDYVAYKKRTGKWVPGRKS